MSKEKKKAKLVAANDLDVVTVGRLIERLQMHNPDLPVEIFNSRGENEAPTVTLVMEGRSMKAKSILLSAESDE